MSAELLNSKTGTFNRKNAKEINLFPEWTDHRELDKAIAIAGYSYDPKQDIFISTMNPWQRSVGYCRLYDEAAAPLGMIIDCEPIYFEYEGKKWMIGLWKGQYDLVTGGEIGIYKEAFDFDVAGIINGVFYNAVSDHELLQMSFELKKNGQILFTREAKHWWLTGFMLGEFSEPFELSMDIKINLKDVLMRDAFLSGLRKAGYTDQRLTIIGNEVIFTFDIPHTPQPFSRTMETDKLIQKKNQLLCERYQEITKRVGNMPEKLKAVQEQAPDLYVKLFNMGKTNSLYETFSVLIRVVSFLLSKNIRK